MGRATAKARLVALLALLLLALACNGGGQTPPSPSPATPTPGTSPGTTPTLPPPPTPIPHILDIATPPDRDLFDLALRFGRIPPGSPRLARQSPLGYKEGDLQEFTVLDITTPKLFTVTAVLHRISEHAYFFFQQGLPVDDRALADAARDFEELVYPSVTANFGREWSPGVDADPRITILHADLGDVAGYFSGSDEFPLAAVPRSNEGEILYVHTGVPLGTSTYNALLAHEFQHMVHWNADAGEESWVNEGLSQVAAEAVAFERGFIDRYLLNPDVQLNDWAPLAEDPTPHYGASQLFFRYLLDRYGGRQRAIDLVRQPLDGIPGLDAYLQEFGVTFLDVFADWLAANYLDADSGPYAHAGATLRIANITRLSAFTEGESTIAQFAAEYLEIEPPEGEAVFRFDGAATVQAVALQPPSGNAFWWSNRGDSIDSRLTCRLDLRDLSAATLTFSLWYETEEGWDYAYVSASSDGGQTWRPLAGRHTTDFDPVAQAYGPGYTGSSGSEARWLEERIDLTPFAGREILIRFEYISDDSTNLRGFAVDDIAVPEAGFLDDAEAAGPCRPQGFVRLDRPLAQRWLLQLIDPQTGQVQRIELEEGRRAEIIIDRPLVLIVAAATDLTRERASYRWSLTSP